VTDLFDLPALANKLQAEVDTGSAIEARRIAQAWLGTATQLTVWPSPIPEDLRTWALELAALVYDNPSWLEQEQVGDVVSRWALNRRAEILTEARRTYATGAATGSGLGSFPDPDPWPDPVDNPFLPVSWRLVP
jgi:hypothetical protein